MEQEKKARGGARPNSGRKLKYGEETITMTFRVPISKKEFIREAVQYILDNELENIEGDDE
jgi:hypothetical protein